MNNLTLVSWSQLIKKAVNQPDQLPAWRLPARTRKENQLCPPRKSTEQTHKKHRKQPKHKIITRSPRWQPCVFRAFPQFLQFFPQFSMAEKYQRTSLRFWGDNSGFLHFFKLHFDSLLPAYMLLSTMAPTVLLLNDLLLKWSCHISTSSFRFIWHFFQLDVQTFQSVLIKTQHSAELLLF